MGKTYFAVQLIHILFFFQYYRFEIGTLIFGIVGLRNNCAMYKTSTTQSLAVITIIATNV